jgi:hypothetical protein
MGRNDEFDGAMWIEAQVERYGPIASTETLRELLGCRTMAALNHALAHGEFDFVTFTLPKRRGQFAFTSEVAAWLVSQRSDAYARTKRPKVVIAERGRTPSEDSD